MYRFEEIRPKLFSEEGLAMFVEIRDGAEVEAKVLIRLLGTK